MSATLIIFSTEKNLGTLGIKPMAAGSWSKDANHCAMLLPCEAITLVRWAPAENQYWSQSPSFHRPTTFWKTWMNFNMETLRYGFRKDLSRPLLEFVLSFLVDWLQWGSVSCRWRYWSRMIACCVFHFSWKLFYFLIWNIFHPGYVLPSNILFTSDGA